MSEQKHSQGPLQQPGDLRRSMLERNHTQVPLRRSMSEQKHSQGPLQQPGDLRRSMLERNHAQVPLRRSMSEQKHSRLGPLQQPGDLRRSMSERNHAQVPLHYPDDIHRSLSEQAVHLFRDGLAASPTNANSFVESFHDAITLWYMEKTKKEQDWLDTNMDMRLMIGLTLNGFDSLMALHGFEA